MDGAIPTDGTLDGTPGDPATQPRAGLPGATAGLGLAGLIDVLDRADGMLPRPRPRPPLPNRLTAPRGRNAPPPAAPPAPLRRVPRRPGRPDAAAPGPADPVA